MGIIKSVKSVLMPALAWAVSQHTDTNMNIKATYILNGTLIIIIMKICKAPTLRLKVLNKHTHIMNIEMEMLSKIFFFLYIDKCSSIIML